MRITKKDLEIKEGRLNPFLPKVKIKLSYNSYIAINLEKDGQIIDTLVSGLTKKQAYNILVVVEIIVIHNFLFIKK